MARRDTRNHAIKLGKHYEKNHLIDKVSYREGVIYSHDRDRPISCICILLKNKKGQKQTEDQEVS